MSGLSKDWFVFKNPPASERVEEIIEFPWVSHFAISPKIFKKPPGENPRVFLSLVLKQLKSI